VIGRLLFIGGRGSNADDMLLCGEVLRVSKTLQEQLDVPSLVVGVLRMEVQRARLNTIIGSCSFGLCLCQAHFCGLALLEIRPGVKFLEKRKCPIRTQDVQAEES